MAAARDLLRFVTAGSVDDGKSTLIGRLLHDAGGLYDDHIEALRKKAGREGKPLDFSLVTDGLKAEREQGITIDVAYRYFETPARRFIIADTPGHEQYTRNMATGASTADLAVILVDAQQGVLTQSRRHGFIASLLGVPRAVVVVNKMDLVGFDAAVFERVRDEFTRFAGRLGFAELRFIPACAVAGDNVVEPSERTPWYDGPTLLRYLETVYVQSDANLIDFRLPIQRVVRPDATFRGYSGTVASGVVRPGDEVVVLPSGRRTRVERIVALEGDRPRAFAREATTITLADEVDAGRGDMLVHPRNVPRVARGFEAMLVWMDAAALTPGRVLLAKHTTRTVRVSCAGIDYRVDPDTLRHQDSGALQLNDIGRARFDAFQPLFLDEYRANRATGALVLIDPETGATAGAAMVIFRERAGDARGSEAVSRNVRREGSDVTPADRAALLGQRPVTLWLTGLSASGKSTLARALERRLTDLGRACYVLDGDNVRLGLNRDLGFAPEDRRENIRRVAEVAKLMNDAGLIVITAFISPYRGDRAMAREAIGADRFVEVHVAATLAACEKRDPKGLYAKARRGDIAEFTGVSAPYEAPEAPAIRLDTEALDVDACVQRLVDALR